MPEISVADTGTGPPAPVVGSRLSFADPHRLMELSSASRGTASPVAQTDAAVAPTTTNYRTPAGTTLMLLNGEPLISFVLMTV